VKRKNVNGLCLVLTRMIPAAWSINYFERKRASGNRQTRLFSFGLLKVFRAGYTATVLASSANELEPIILVLPIHRSLSASPEGASPSSAGPDFVI
jgi:hypothetical protein